MPTEVGFKLTSTTVSEGDGTIWIEITRTGDLTVNSTVWFKDNFSHSSTTAETTDMLFNPHVAGSNVYYWSSTRSGYVHFEPGVKSIKIPYSITNDQKEEAAERLYFEITGVSAGTTIGRKSTYVKINESDIPIEVDIRDTSVNEGGDLEFTLVATANVTQNVWVDYRVYYGQQHVEWTTGKAFISVGERYGKVVIPTLSDTDQVDAYIRVEIFNISGADAVIGDDTARGDIVDTTPVSVPTLSLHNSGFASEGSISGSYAKLSFAVDYNVTFTVTTYYGTYSEANAGGHTGDYNGFIERQFTITAGNTTAMVPVTILPDAIVEGNERFELRIDPSSVNGASLGTDRVVMTIVNTTPEPEAPAGTPLSASDLTEWRALFNENEETYGTTTLAGIVSADAELWAIGQTLDAFGLLSGALKAAVTWFAGSVAYAYKEQVLSLDLGLTQNQINQGLRMGSFAPGNEPDVGSVTWTSAELGELGTLASVVLRAGDYVDGRLVIHQPLIGFDAAGNEMEFNSSQGRFEASVPGDMTSHHDNTVPAAHSFDWGGRAANGRPVFAVAPVDGYVVYATDNFGNDPTNDGWENDSNKNNNSGFGNVVTMRAAQTDGAGDPIFITLAHLAEGSAPDYLISVESVNPLTDTQRFVKAGQVIGLMGNTGAGDKHLHMQVGKLVDAVNGRPWLTDASIDENGATPPVYLMFGDASIAERHQLDTNVGASAVQDKGFPIGDSDYGERTVVSGIKSTFDYYDFILVNPHTAIGGEFVTPDPTPPNDDNDTDGSSGGSGGSSSGGSSTPTPPPSTPTTPNDIGVIGTNDFGVGVEFTLTAASEVDTLFHLTTTGRARNFVSVLIDHTTGLLKGEVAWLGNGQSYSEYLSVPLANLPFTVGSSHTVALARVNLPDGSTRLELWFDGVVVDTTLTTAVPNLPAFTVVEVGQMTNWYSGSVQHPATGTFGALQVGTAETLFTAPETPATTLSPTPTIISGTSGDDDFTGATGDQRYEGGTGYDEVKYFGPGSRSDAFVFTQQTDGSVLASSPAFGEDTLTSIEGIWFDEEAKWYSLEQLLTTPATTQVIMGTIGDDVLVAETGGRTYDGLAGFDQIDFYGPASYTHLFTASARSDGGVELTSDAFGVTVLYGVESVWFDWSGEWYLVEDLLNSPTPPVTPTVISGTSGDDDFTGATGDQRYEGGAGYDEVKYFGLGSRSDAFVFTQQTDGSVLASSPAFGEDTLTSIEGIWFDEEAKWYSVPTLLAMAGVVTGTPSDETFVGVAGNTIYQDQGGFDQIDYNGPGSTRDAFVFTARADGGVQVVSTAFGTDTLYGVESVWFDWDGAWYLTTDLLV